MTLTVVTYNVREGGAGRVDSLAAVLRTTGADAVALLEASERTVAADLAALLGMELVFGESRGPLGMHVAWLTRLSVRRAENHALPQLAKTLLELEVEWAGAPLRLFATHLTSRHEETRYPREREVAAILAVLETAGPQRILVGDLNALHPDDLVGAPPPGVEPRGDALPGASRAVLRRFLAAGYVDCFRRLHSDEPGFTYPAAAPWLRLDYVLAPRSLAARVGRCEVVTAEPAATASDHLPVLAVLE
jgi:exodeoxyribonuclease III